MYMYSLLYYAMFTSVIILCVQVRYQLPELEVSNSVFTFRHLEYTITLCIKGFVTVFLTVMLNMLLLDEAKGRWMWLCDSDN